MNRFAEKLGEGFASLGHEIEFVDLLAADKNKQLLIDALARQPNMVVGFNGMGAELKTVDKKSVYEISGSEYLAILLDHPAFHTRRTAFAPAGAIAGVCDLSHMDYLQEVWPQHPIFFAPHGGIQDEDYKNTDRPIDILFCGTGLDPNNERRQWQSFPASYHSMLTEAYEGFMESPQAWDSLLLNAAQKRHLYLPRHLMAAMIVQLEMVMRAEYRSLVLKKFDEAGLKVTIMGNGWEHAKFKHHELHKSIEYYDMLKLLCKSKTSLNISPQFFTGTHERVFHSMLNGCVAVTSESRYYIEHLKEGTQYLGYELSTLSKTIETIKELFSSRKKLVDLQNAGRIIAEKDHTWHLPTALQKTMVLLEII
jgi:hypothetical protein